MRYKTWWDYYYSSEIVYMFIRINASVIHIKARNLKIIWITSVDDSMRERLSEGAVTYHVSLRRKVLRAYFFAYIVLTFEPILGAPNLLGWWLVWLPYSQECLYGVHFSVLFFLICNWYSPKWLVLFSLSSTLIRCLRRLIILRFSTIFSRFGELSCYYCSRSSRSIR